MTEIVPIGEITGRYPVRQTPPGVWLILDETWRPSRLFATHDSYDIFLIGDFNQRSEADWFPLPNAREQSKKFNRFGKHETRLMFARMVEVSEEHTNIQRDYFDALEWLDIAQRARENPKLKSITSPSGTKGFSR
jgi:hypothetical protein